ncbi:MAG: alpha-glucosidase [Spirochaetales bacterium]|nr:alpha-glucosidase [Spirochaetales bacterium]
MEKRWWHKEAVYQIYPRSFKDSNGDGIGDLQGIISELDYLEKLGVKVIWLSPIYKSPMDDNGYDISDYRVIAPEFGTMEDFDELIEKSSKKGIRLVMDLVVNHTSDEHPWFIESRSSRDNPKRDWYIWKDPAADGGVPNNWGSYFTRSAWEPDEKTGQYYLHLFSKKQPDLNWANRQVREAVYDMMHFWLKKGIGGFRMDVINMIGKPADFPPAAITDRGVAGFEHWANNSRAHEYLREMHRDVLSRYDVLTVGETPFVTPFDGQLYSHPDRKELGMIFQFEHMDVDRGALEELKKPLDLVKFKQIMSNWQTGLEGRGWNSNYWSNHDQARAVSRFGNDREYRVESARMLGTTLHMMSGTPYIYQGEEIGAVNTYYDRIEDYNDLMDHHYYDLLINDHKMSPAEAIRRIQPFSRDNARVPMRWTGGKNNGFTSGEPWLKMDGPGARIYAEEAMADENSIFYHYKELIRLRRESEYSDTIVYGKSVLLDPEDPSVYAFIREGNGQRLLVVSNFTTETLSRSYPYEVKKAVLSNYEMSSKEADARALTLRPYESVVFSVRATPVSISEPL